MDNPFEFIAAQLNSIEARLQKLDSLISNPTTGANQSGEAAPYVSKREAARLLSCSQSTIDNYARAGRLKRHYIGKSVRFDRLEVLSLAKGHTSTKQR